jgi:hypothetical protein
VPAPRHQPRLLPQLARGRGGLAMGYEGYEGISAYRRIARARERRNTEIPSYPSYESEPQG